MLRACRGIFEIGTPSGVAGFLAGILVCVAVLAFCKRDRLTRQTTVGLLTYLKRSWHTPGGLLIFLVGNILLWYSTVAVDPSPLDVSGCVVGMVMFAAGPTVMCLAARRADRLRRSAKFDEPPSPDVRDAPTDSPG